MIVTTSLLIEVGFRISDARDIINTKFELKSYIGLNTLAYSIPPDPDLVSKCQSDKILIPISKNPHLMDEDSDPNLS